MKALSAFWPLLRPYRGWMALGVLGALVTLLANVMLMAVSGWFITAMAVAGAAGVSINYFTPAALIRLAAMLRTLGRYSERLATHEATLHLLASLRVWLYRRLVPLAPAALDDLHSGDILSRIRGDVDALDNLYIRVLVPVVVATVGGTLFFLFLLLYDARVALLSLGFMVLAGVVVPWWSRAVGEAPGKRAAQAESDLRVACVDGLQGMAELQVLGAAGSQAERIDSLSRELARDQVHLAGLSGVAHGAAGLCMHLSLWGLLWLLIPLVQSGQLLPPQLAMLALFTLASFEAVAPLPLAFQQLGRTTEAARRLRSLIERTPALREPAGTAHSPDGHGLVIEGLGFGYPGGARAVLEDVDLRVAEGERLAIIGASGSGKSTLLDLILGFRAAGSGEIRIGGVPVGEMQGDRLRRLVTLVGQRSRLLDASIRANLLIANPQAPEAALEQACRTARIHAFIESLPEGYDTWVGETGVRLSGGQARRIAIARALLRDAPILLLDEPTEGLDAETAAALMSSLVKLMAGRTVILVTHRAVGLDRVDRVVKLGRGRIVADGEAAASGVL